MALVVLHGLKRLDKTQPHGKITSILPLHLTPTSGQLFLICPAAPIKTLPWGSGVGAGVPRGLRLCVGEIKTELLFASILRRFCSGAKHPVCVEPFAERDLIDTFKRIESCVSCHP